MQLYRVVSRDVNFTFICRVEWEGYHLPLFSSEYPEFSLFPMLVPTLFSSSMMVARLVLWLAGDSGPGLTGSWWHWSWGECGNKLEREREAATAPHSCNYFQRIKVCSDQQRTRNQSVSQSIMSIFVSIRLPDLIVVVRSRYILAWQQGDKQIRCICIWRVEYPSHPLTLAT